MNVIWQADANEYALRCLSHCASPAKVLNVTGPQIVSVKWLAQQFGQAMDKKPIFENEPATTALLSDSSQAHRLMGQPKIGLEQMINWTADWVQLDGEQLNKPTHFQERGGSF